MSSKRWIAFGMVLFLTVPGWSAVGAASEAPARTAVVKVMDRCDPVTFNQALGDGACAPTPKGNVTFNEFLSKLNPTDFGHKAWRNQPITATIEEGTVLQATSTGGEFHTFTEVPEFGPGCVAELNDPLGLEGHPVVRCTNEVFATTGLPPGATIDVPPLAVGTHLFECIIHPWMRSTITVVAKG